MYFSKAIDELRLSENKKECLRRLLDKWDGTCHGDMINLAKERFLSPAAMKFIVLFLSELPGYCSIDEIKQRLRTHFYTWLQLVGVEVDYLPSGFALLGMVVPTRRLKNFYQLHYQARFSNEREIDRFLLDLELAPYPHEYLAKKKMKQLYIKDPTHLNWFFWSSSFRTPNPFDLPTTLSSAELRRMLHLPDIEEYRELALMTFRYDKESKPTSSWELRQATWADADFMPSFRSPHPSRLEAVVNDGYIKLDKEKEVIAEGVSRSGVVQLENLVKFKVLP